MTRALFALLLQAAALASAVSAAAVEPAAIVALDEVEPGARGYGLSVFHGSEPERFDVEVLGIWRDVLPGTSYILARLTGQDLEQSGVIAGMSGSPVYLDGRLAGAVSFGWPFAHQAIAGITPIEAMRGLMTAPPEAVAAPAAAVPDLAGLAAARVDPELLTGQLAGLVPHLTEGALTGVQWTAVGFGDRSREWLARGLGDVAAAGATTAGTGRDLLPGQSVAGVLVDGDLRLAATGTVTDRVGDEIVAFGHPFLGVGPLRLPMATAEVVTVLSSRYSSFKIANLGPVVGAIDLDRRPGIRGHLGAEAPMIPLEVAVDGDHRRRFDLRVADLPLASPGLVAVAVLGCLDASTQAGGNQGLDLLAHFDLGRRGLLEVRQSFDGPSAATDAALYLFAFAGFILQNDMEAVEIRALDVSLTQHREPRTSRLVEAHAGKTVVRPGETVPLNLDLVAYRGERSRRAAEVRVPTSLPDGRYSLLVGDGVSIDVARLAVERASPVDFNQALTFLRSLHSRRDLVILGLFSGPGLSVAGEVLPQLPGSLRSIWGAASTAGAVPVGLAIADQQELESEVPLEGILRVDLEVRRQEPLTAGSEGGEEAGGGEEGSGAGAAVEEGATQVVAEPTDGPPGGGA